MADTHTTNSPPVTVRVNVDRPAGSVRASGSSRQTELSTERDYCFVLDVSYGPRTVAGLIAPVLCH